MSNFSSAFSCVNAPFFTPSNKCFFNRIPLYDKIARAVSVGTAPFCNHESELSKLISISAGFIFGLYVPSFSINLPSLFALESATTK